MSVREIAPGRGVFAFFMLLTMVSPAFSQATLLDQGEELFLNNQMDEALPVLKTALLQEPTNEKIYLYLGTIYEQMGDYEQAVSVLQRGLQYANLHKDFMYFNIANNLFNQGKFILAEEIYSRAVDANPDLTNAYLNRANTRIKTGSHMGAVDDYTLYLSLRPTTPQRENIEKILAILTAKIEAEMAQIRQEEEQRKAEEEKQQSLLNEVLSSLQNASGDTKSLSVETEGIEEVKEESDIVD